MNAGLADAAELSGQLGAVLNGSAPAIVLDGHGQRWEQFWRKLHGMEGVAEAKPGTPELIRKNAARVVSCLPANKKHVGILAERLGITI
jgi:hypothetical protein